MAFGRLPCNCNLFSFLIISDIDWSQRFTYYNNKNIIIKLDVLLCMILHTIIHNYTNLHTVLHSYARFSVALVRFYACTPMLVGMASLVLDILLLSKNSQISLLDHNIIIVHGHQKLNHLELAQKIHACRD